MKNVNYLLVAFFAFLLKTIIIPPSFSDAIIFFVLASTFSFKYYLDIKKIQEKTMEETKKIEKDIEELKTSISSMKIAKGFNGR